MKKLLSLFVVLFLCISLSSCHSRRTDFDAPDTESTPSSGQSESWIENFFQTFARNGTPEQVVKKFCKDMKNWNRDALTPFAMSDDELAVALSTARLAGDLLNWLPFVILFSSARSTQYQFDIITEMTNLARESAEKIRYRIVESVRDGDVSDVTVMFTYPDLTEAFREFTLDIDHMFSNFLPQFTSLSPESESYAYLKSWDESFFELFQKKAREAPYYQEEIVFHCVKREREWVIDSVPSVDIERILWCCSNPIG